jgi:hypothetical protein
MRSINLLFLSGIRRNLPEELKVSSLYLSVRREIKEILVIIGAY